MRFHRGKAACLAVACALPIFSLRSAETPFVPSPLDEWFSLHYANALEEVPWESDVAGVNAAGDRLQDCHYRRGNPNLVFIFEGTGNYNPWEGRVLHEALAEVAPRYSAAQLRAANERALLALNQSLPQIPAHPPSSVLLNAIVLSATIHRDQPPDFAEDGEIPDFQWVHFPSEEVDFDFSRWDWDTFLTLTRSQTLGLQRAEDCLLQIRQEALAQAADPTLTLLGYSSGARTAVKFAERLNQRKPKNIRVQLMLTLDPVMEAIWAFAADVLPSIKGALDEVGGNQVQACRELIEGRETPVAQKLRRWLEENKPVVGGRTHYPGLYKPGNVEVLENYYQRTDETGARSNIVPNCIHGSLVTGASGNEEIRLAPEQQRNGHYYLPRDPYVVRQVLGDLQRWLRDEVPPPTRAVP